MDYVTGRSSCLAARVLADYRLVPAWGAIGPPIRGRGLRGSLKQARITQMRAGRTGLGERVVRSAQ